MYLVFVPNCLKIPLGTEPVPVAQVTEKDAINYICKILVLSLIIQIILSEF